MFKAKLIESPTYYSLKNKQILLFILYTIFFSLMYNMFSFPLSLGGLAIVGMALVIFFMIKNGKATRELISKSTLQVDENCLRIFSGKENMVQSFELGKLNRITVKKQYQIPEDTMGKAVKELAKDAVVGKNYLTVEQDGKTHQFDFVIDSYYMIQQLEKLITAWEQKGFPVLKV